MRKLIAVLKLFQRCQSMERIMITIPTDLLRDVDSIAKRLKRNRSQLARQALAELLQKLKQQEFEALLAEDYREMSQENSAIVAESIPIQADAIRGVRLESIKRLRAIQGEFREKYGEMPSCVEDIRRMREERDVELTGLR